jgi:hypothetical protein
MKHFKGVRIVGPLIDGRRTIPLQPDYAHDKCFPGVWIGRLWFQRPSCPWSVDVKKGYFSMTWLQKGYHNLVYLLPPYDVGLETLNCFSSKDVSGIDSPSEARWFKAGEAAII